MVLLLGLALLMKVLAIGFECSMGSHSSHLKRTREFDKDGAVRRMLDNPTVWSDGGVVLDEVSGASSARSGMSARVLVMHGGIVSGGTWIWCSWHMGV